MVWLCSGKKKKNNTNLCISTCLLDHRNEHMNAHVRNKGKKIKQMVDIKFDVGRTEKLVTTSAWSNSKF